MQAHSWATQTCALQGYASALMGNTLMCSHFAHRAERSAVNVQLIGIASNLLVLSQASETVNLMVHEIVIVTATGRHR
eukprot:scaffold59693_cov22-Tisochrysis_lutea.AAC.1